MQASSELWWSRLTVFPLYDPVKAISIQYFPGLDLELFPGERDRCAILSLDAGQRL